jgi:hypothetical protein
LQDEQDVAVKLKSNKVKIGPITKACAKLIKQQVNSLLNDTLIDENFILPKSFYLCMIRYEDEASVARGGEEQLNLVLHVKTFHECAREEREAGASRKISTSGTAARSSGTAAGTTALPSGTAAPGSGTAAHTSGTAA